MEEYTERLKEDIEKSKYYSQTEALVEMIRGENMYLSGPAGSGKSYVIEKFVKYMTKHRPELNIAITAPQGTAAVNINGVTFHSFTGMGISKLDFFDRGGVSDYVAWQIKKTDIIIIDEISMLSAWQLRFLLEELKFYRKDDWHKVQLIVSGDFSQLPPVATARDSKEMAELCYGKLAWNEFKPKNTYLDRVYRAEDEALKVLLNKLSLGEAAPIDLADLKVISKTEGLSIPVLVSTNKRANEINTTNHNNNMSTEMREFDVDIPMDKGLDFFRTSEMYARQSGMDKPVKVKTGDTVMITVNESSANEYCVHIDPFAPKLQNGMIGKIIKIVEGKNVGVVFRYIDPDTGERYRYAIHSKCEFQQSVIKTNPLNGKKYEEIVASFMQVPFKLAYAISIHKSQGQTYSHVITDLSNCWTENLGYVALSRAKTIGGLYLLRNKKGKVLGKKALKVSDESIIIKQEVFRDSYIGDDEYRYNLLVDKIKENDIVLEDVL